MFIFLSGWGMSWSLQHIGCTESSSEDRWNSSGAHRRLVCLKKKVELSCLKISAVDPQKAQVLNCWHLDQYPKTKNILIDTLIWLNFNSMYLDKTSTVLTISLFLFYSRQKKYRQHYHSPIKIWRHYWKHQPVRKGCSWRRLWKVLTSVHFPCISLTDCAFNP